MGINVSMQFGGDSTVKNANSFQPVLLGTDTSGNTSQNNFELSDNLSNYKYIQIICLFNWSSSTNIHYFITPQVPVVFLDLYANYNTLVFRQPAYGTRNDTIEFYIQKVDENHIKLEKIREAYSFRTIYVYGIR